MRRRKPGPARRELCGTASGNRRHYRDGEKPCEPCREAKNRYERQRIRPAVGVTPPTPETLLKLGKPVDIFGRLIG